MSNRPTASPQPPHHYHLHGNQHQQPPTLTAFQELIQDLTRDAQRAQPKDALQFCANWFNSRLAEQRTRLIDLVLATTARNQQPQPHASPLMNSSLNLGSPASRRTSSPSPFGTLNVPGNQAFSTPATHRAPLPISNNEGGPYLGPPASALGRRVSVSAESIEPSTGPEIPPPFYYKSPEQLKRLQDSIANAFLFRNLDDKKRKAVLGAMKEMKFDKNVRVITQGDAGDYFYVVDSGELDCFVKPKISPCPKVSRTPKMTAVHSAGTQDPEPPDTPTPPPPSPISLIL
ncbi:hypothetical protein M407DRAFT_9518 [Tulasnella calospora MUT 4182]|uniref:Cyclic nucleotide-binding domain-containing protein n=1 Tax=Tulasnella calospora MUT 4182 TaxID=1051891 RepID=A0A0C3QCP8_9AGAM|nr:hypothetical protein M407DRAFT_9518 [Tulasnella calospora MUT 4182]